MSLSSLSGELQKPCQGQPSVSEVLQVVLKECHKDNLVYKIGALRCAGDVLHASQEDYFSTMAEILFPLIKKVLSRPLASRHRVTVSKPSPSALLNPQSCPESGGVSPRSREDDDDSAGRKEKELQTEALLCAFDTLGKSWPRNTETQGGFKQLLLVGSEALI